MRYRRGSKKGSHKHRPPVRPSKPSDQKGQSGVSGGLFQKSWRVLVEASKDLASIGEEEIRKRPRAIRIMEAIKTYFGRLKFEDLSTVLVWPVLTAVVTLVSLIGIYVFQTKRRG